MAEKDQIGRNCAQQVQKSGTVWAKGSCLWLNPNHSKKTPFIAVQRRRS
jgi:hypothetical protein